MLTIAPSHVPLYRPDRPSKLVILGVNVSAINHGQVLRLCRQWIEQQRKWKDAASPGSAPTARCIAFVTVHAVMTAVFDPEFRAVLNQADITNPDGMPLAWALRSFGVRGQRRVYGPDLTLALCGQAARLGHRIFLYGGREETLPVLCALLMKRFPSLKVAGAYAPPFRPLTAEEDAACVARIRASDADIIFVGIGVPKQERWIVEHRQEFPGVVMLGVGAAFDFHAGRVRQAPRWMQQGGLEWLFRLLMEPGRLWRRYVFLNPLFLAMWTMQKAGILKYSAPSDLPENPRPSERLS